MILGQGDYKYERVEGWAKIPEYFVLGDPTDIACDSRDRVYVFCTGNHPVLIFDRNGDFISCWGETFFRQSHGIFIDSNDFVYLTDRQTHTVEKFTLGGEHLMTLGRRNWVSPPIRGAPFNMPTGVCVGPSGDLFVSDGYGNRRVHKFSPDGKLIKSWGAQGNGPSQFVLPHNIFVDKYGTVYVCDREAGRIQLFTSDGEYITEWAGLNRPADLYIDLEKDIAYVAERGTPNPPRISIRDLKGNVLSSWEGFESEGKGGVLEVCHGIGVDSHGDIYEGELGSGGKPQRIQKFAKVS